MRIISYLVFTLAFVSCVNCTDKQGKLPKLKKIEGCIFGEEIQMRIPGTIFYVDSTFILHDPFCTDNYLLKTYNLEGKLEHKSITLGRGPKDLLTPSCFQIHNNKFNCYDPNLKKFYEYNLDSILLKSNISWNGSKQMDTLVNYLNLIKLGSDKLVGINLKNRKFLTLLSSEGNMTDYYSYPLYTSNLLVENLKFANQYHLQSFENKLLCISRNFPDIHLFTYDSNKKRLHEKWKTQLVKPEYKIRDGKLIWDKENIEGFSASYMTQKYIYVAYKGYPINTPRAEKRAHKLIVFDYEGNIIKYYKTDYPIFSFCVDDKDQFIYAVTETPEYRFVRFNLDH